MNPTTHLYPVILAGGIGSRLWPRSRKGTPKQFLDLSGSGRTMLQDAFDRIRPLVNSDQVYVITNAEYVQTVLQQLPELPAVNVVGEPAARGSAAAIGLAAIHLQARDAEAIMAVLTADHIIRQPEALRQVLLAGAELAQAGELITLGIQPTYAETGYGYIEMGDLLGDYNDRPAYRVRRFREKPDQATAEAFLAAGNYVWNSGMFIWRVDRIMAEFARQMPGLHAALLGLAPTLGSPEEATAFEHYWMPLTGNVAIDYGVMEGAQAAVFPVDLGWDDVGSWAALLEILPKDDDGNVVHAKHLHYDSSNVLVYSPRPPYRHPRPAGYDRGGHSRRGAGDACQSRPGREEADRCATGAGVGEVSGVGEVEG